MKKITLISVAVLLLPIVAVSQPACPGTPAPLDTYQWILIFLGIALAGFILNRKSILNKFRKVKKIIKKS